MLSARVFTCPVFSFHAVRASSAKFGFGLCCIAVLLLAQASTVHGQCEASETAKLIASDAAPNDGFGISVAVSGETAVVGAFADNHAGGSNAGSAYVFLRTGGIWAQQAKLTASDAATDDEFGRTVAVSGDTAVVGAYLDDHFAGNNAGSAYVFVRSGGVWTQQAKLIPADPAADDSFGNSVAVSGDTAVIGSSLDNNAGGGAAGSAYVFVRSGGVWTQQAKLTASDGAVNDVFGISVALSGDTAVVGAYADNHPGGVNAGSAYVFVRSGIVWTQQAKLTASDAAGGDIFGFSVAVSGDTAVAGAYFNDHAGGTDAGAAYEFVKPGGGWANMTQTAKLIASDAAAFDLFGDSVAVSGDTAVVGAYYAEHAGDNAGSAYVFFRSGGVWTQHAKLTPSDAATSDRFGVSVAVAGNTAVVGADIDDHAGGIDAGSAYVFNLAATDCNTNGTFDFCENDVDGDGIIDDCDNCPMLANFDQGDYEFDGVGDACDNCMFLENPGQEDCDTDGIGDACESTPTARLYVNPDATGANNGSGWADAFLELRDALSAANCPPGDAIVTEIWVADGIYKPAPPGGSRSASFTMRSGLAIYGGFAGGETMLSERDPETNITILSGDLNGDDGPNFGKYGENSLHVVIAGAVDSTAVMDGFTISGGYASPSTTGGGLWAASGSPTITRCVFCANWADSFGGGAAGVLASSIRFTNCKFIGNSAVAQGGGVAAVVGAASATLTNCIFSGNCSLEGGGMYGLGTLTNCTFSNNSAVNQGGGLSGTTTVTNCVFRGNTAPAGAQIAGSATATYCNIEGGYAGTGNISTDPLLADPDGQDNILGTIDDDLHILAGSPCIDAANSTAVPADTADLDGDANTAEPTPYDLGGNKRFVDDPATIDSGPSGPPDVDMGAFEFFPDCNNNGIDDADDILADPSIDLNPTDGIPDSCCFCTVAGNWGNAATWGCGVVPNNTPDDRYNVNITCPAPAVDLDIPVTIDSVRVEAGQNLQINGANLSIDSSGGVHNDGTLVVADSRQIGALVSTQISGAAPVRLAGADAVVASVGATAVITNVGAIAGRGQVTARFDNKGTVTADDPAGTGILSLRTSTPKSSSGLIQAVGGGTLEVRGAPITGDGNWRADGGTIAAGTALQGGTINGGSLTIDNGGEVLMGSAPLTVINIAGPMTIASGVYQGAAGSSGSLTADSLTMTSDGATGSEYRAAGSMQSHMGYFGVIGCGGLLRGCIPPVEDFTENSETEIGDFYLEGAVEITVDGNAEVRVSGNFDNRCTSPTIFDWDDGILRMNGTSPQTFELAGEDRGHCNPAGFVDNFAFGTLEIAAGAEVTFVDAFDNIPGAGCEVLYVETLILGSGCTIHLDGCSVYYQSMGIAAEPPPVIDLQNGALFVSTVAGDMDADTDVDMTDVGLFAAALVGQPCFPTPCTLEMSDLNGDRLANALDIEFMIQLVGEDCGS